MSACILDLSFLGSVEGHAVSSQRRYRRGITRLGRLGSESGSAAVESSTVPKFHIDCACILPCIQIIKVYITMEKFYDIDTI